MKICGQGTPRDNYAFIAPFVMHIGVTMMMMKVPSFPFLISRAFSPSCFEIIIKSIGFTFIMNMLDYCLIRIPIFIKNNCFFDCCCEKSPFFLLPIINILKCLVAMRMISLGNQNSGFLLYILLLPLPF